MSDYESEGPSWGLVMVRLAVGATLAIAGWQKILGGVGAELVSSTKSRVAEAPQWFESFMNAVVYPYPEAFAQMIQWGELLGGVALFLGALTRPAGVMIGLMMIAFSYAGPAEQTPFALLVGLCSFACALSRAGRRMGLDAIFDGHFPGWISWTRAPA